MDILKIVKSLVKRPILPFKGSFNVRVGHDLHMAASVVASRENISLNDLARRALSEYIMNHAE